MTCRSPGCDREKLVARGLCRTHYQRWWKTGTTELPTHGDRFWTKVNKAGPGGCWLWTGAISAGGYGKFSVNYADLLAHRYSYELAHGPIPEGKEIDHECHSRAREKCHVPGKCLHRRCVNPDHLALVDRRTNLLRGNTFQSANAAKTHCPAGHEFTPENTYTTPRGERNCRLCRNRQMRQYRARKRERLSKRCS